MVNLSGNHLVLLFCAHIGSIPLSEMVHDALATAVMARPDLHHCYTTLLQHILLVSNNPYIDFSLLSQHLRISESMEATLKMHMHIFRQPETPTFVSIDDAYADWHEHRFKKS